MLLMFDEKHKKHLAFLLDIGLDVLQEFGRLSLDFIKKGANPKVYQSAAQKLGVSVETVQHGVEGLMYLLTESSKLMISEIDFQDSIMTLGFSEEMRQALLELYLSRRREIRDILNELSMDLPHYHNLEWRFDVEQDAILTLLHPEGPKLHRVLALLSAARLRTKKEGHILHGWPLDPSAIKSHQQ